MDGRVRRQGILGDAHVQGIQPDFGDDHLVFGDDLKIEKKNQYEDPYIDLFGPHLNPFNTNLVTSGVLIQDPFEPILTHFDPYLDPFDPFLVFIWTHLDHSVEITEFSATQILREINFKDFGGP